VYALLKICLTPAQRAQPRVAGAILEPVIMALLSHHGTIFIRLRRAGTMWFDAKDIQSVASNYIILEPSTVDGKLFSM
jgi:hypothetical protein